MAPLVLPVCALYFGLSSVMYRWLFRHVYSQEFDCHGGWWRQMFNGSMFGLLGGSLALCGIFGLNTAATSRQFYVMWGLPLMVIAFHWVCNSRLEPRSREMPYQDAVLADAFAGSQAVVGSFCDDYYRGPFHKVDWAMCNDGKAEAENWRAVRPGQDRPL
ncbi:unnamed protein product [Prorocentrum cordatum]|uniref:CSC1/OSCA1-like 7TM region domain-containing protein n=1 Tax=Prorocentrum cordatum TaxID=2364126 RepID=A0ABN9XIQ2_9DINO|nr:unnamed protein product [Polarella glacialis]